MIEAVSENPTAELRAAILNLDTPRPVVVKRRYGETSPETLAVKAAADLGVLFLDGLADGIWIDAPGFAGGRDPQYRADDPAGGARALLAHRIYRLSELRPHALRHREDPRRRQVAHVASENLKIGVMGCIVNGPGRDGRRRLRLRGRCSGAHHALQGRTVVERNIPQEEALDRLVELIRDNGDWVEP